MEEPLFLTEFPTHRQKLLHHRLSLQAYVQELQAAGFTVQYLDVRSHPTSESIWHYLHNAGITSVHIADTTDDWLEQRIARYSTAYGIERIFYPSQIFILQNDYRERYQKSHKRLVNFYTTLRRDTSILVDQAKKPLGGSFSLDSENRKKLPAYQPLPTDISDYENEDTKEAKTWLAELPGEHYGVAAVWLPYTRAHAKTFFADFLHERFSGFGTYEDALVSKHHRIFHSTISPLLNIGLLEPMAIISEAVTYGKENNIPLNNIEGFVRQILGWREFVRAAYEVDGRTMRTKNFFAHKHPLPHWFWTGDTTLYPLQDSINKALATGYNHHIERLMVLGNFLLLSETNPNEVYRWFMAMYVDAYDWVMVPNVYGMSQFADGGIFTTKPYIAGANYLRKMSNYPKGPWEDTYTALYWHFIEKNQNFFLKNHRLRMMPRLLARLPTTTRTTYQKTVADYFASLKK